MTLRRIRIPAVALALSFGLAAPIRAQSAAESCTDGRVARILVDNQSIFADEQIEGERFEWAFRLANALHIRTAVDLVRSELLLSEGDCYDAYRVADSERILRRYQFLSDAETFGVRRPDGDWDVRVRTRDEWSTLIEATGELDGGLKLRRASVSEENFLGRGILVQGFYEERDAQRLVGARFHTPRILGTRTDLAVEGGQTRRGRFFGEEIVYPFVGEVGQWALRQRFSISDDFFQYAVTGIEGAGYALLPVEDEFLELSLARRWGEPGDLLVGGIGISRDVLEFRDFEGGVELVGSGEDFGSTTIAGQEVEDLLRPQTRFESGTRLNLLFGHRAIRFSQRTGLDALRGVQDLAIGSDVSLSFGRSLGATSGSGIPDDMYSRLRIYAAGSPAPFTFVFDGVVEGRQILSGSGVGEGGWRDLFAEVRLLSYWQPGRFPNHTLFARLTGVGGWSVDQPFQLTLGGRSGVRGYRPEEFPGAARVQLTLEDRIYLGWPAPNLFDMGLTLFTDLGRMWAVDAPFGVNSGWRGTVGTGLRFGFPTGTRGVVRMDLAFPVDERGVRSPVFRISALDLFGLSGGGRDPQLARSRRILSGPDSFVPPY